MSTTPEPSTETGPESLAPHTDVPRQRGLTIPLEVTCRQARSPEELAAHHAIRYQVFVAEQGMFAGSDRDAHDTSEDVIRILGYLGDVAGGTVRLFELDHDTGLWQGDRLAVLPQYRTHGLGAPLVRCAVATAGALGGLEMVAHIQLPNVRFFTRLGWTPSGQTEIYAGRPHQPMRTPLPDAELGASLTHDLAHGRLPHA